MDFKSSLDRGEFVLHYQPVVCLNSRKVVGYEALARWQQGKDIFAPWYFVAALNASPYLHRWLSSQVTQVSDAITAIPHPQWISFNLSPESLRLPNLGTILDQCHDPRRLRLEVSESVILGDFELGVLRELHWSYHLSADDFGCRGSDFGRLIEAELFDTIKLDRRITQECHTDPRKGKICAFVLGLIETLRMGSVSEWVESERQARWLLEYGCAMGQGSLYGMAAPLKNPDQ